MVVCNKCGKDFQPEKGLRNFCSLACRNSKEQTEEVRAKKSKAAKISNKNPTKGKFGKENPNWKPRTFTTCLVCEQPIEHEVSKARKYHAKCWLKISGGLREGSTIKHRCEYKGFLMDSGAEKAFAMRCDELGIKWVKNKIEFFDYVDLSGKNRKYYPDFYLPQFGRWVEVKGKFYQKKDPFFELKIKAIKDLILVYSGEIKSFNGVA